MCFFPSFHLESSHFAERRLLSFGMDQKLDDTEENLIHFQNIAAQSQNLDRACCISLPKNPDPPLNNLLYLILLYFLSFLFSFFEAKLYLRPTPIESSSSKTEMHHVTWCGLQQMVNKSRGRFINIIVTPKLHVPKQLQLYSKRARTTYLLS